MQDPPLQGPPTRALWTARRAPAPFTLPGTLPRTRREMDLDWGFRSTEVSWSSPVFESGRSVVLSGRLEHDLLEIDRVWVQFESNF